MIPMQLKEAVIKLLVKLIILCLSWDKMVKTYYYGAKTISKLFVKRGNGLFDIPRIFMLSENHESAEWIVKCDSVSPWKICSYRKNALAGTTPKDSVLF